MSLISLIANDNFISVNRDIIKKLGLECAVILGELCSEYTHWEKTGQLKNGMFYCTVEKLKENTSLSKYQQLQAIEKLQNKGIILVELHGVPATRYFRIDEVQLSNFLTSDSCQKTDQLVVQKLDSSNTNNTKDNNTNTTNVVLEQPTVTHQPKRRIKLVDTPESVSDTDTVSKSAKKKNLFEKCAEYIDIYTQDIKLHDILIEYLKFRLAVKDKPIYLPQWKSMVNTLDDLTDDVTTKYKIVQQSLNGGNLKFFELKKYTRNYNKNIGFQDPTVFSEYGQVKSEKRANEVIMNVQF
jgi:hypothetical protein